jgi:hypothetical protein
MCGEPADVLLVQQVKALTPMGAVFLGDDDIEQEVNFCCKCGRDQGRRIADIAEANEKRRGVS